MAGLMREREEHLTDNSLDVNSTRMTFSARFKYQNEYKTTFYITSYFQPKVDEPNDSRSLFEIGFDVPVHIRFCLFETTERTG